MFVKLYTPKNLIITQMRIAYAQVNRKVYLKALPSYIVIHTLKTNSLFTISQDNSTKTHRLST